MKTSMKSDVSIYDDIHNEQNHMNVARIIQFTFTGFADFATWKNPYR